MAVLMFDQRGNLTPYTCIPVDLETVLTDLVIPFPASQTRARLYDRYLLYLTALKETGQKSWVQWIGGSFASAKLNPADIDCVNLIEFAIEPAITLLMPFMLIGGSVDRFGVDGHLIAVYPENDERYRLITQPSCNYWFHFLQNDRDNQPRGFIELKLD